MSAKSRLNVLFMIVYLNKSEVRTYVSSGLGNPPKSTLAKIRATGYLPLHSYPWMAPTIPPP